MKRTTAGLLLAISAAFTGQAQAGLSDGIPPTSSSFISQFLYALTNNQYASQRSNDFALNLPDDVRARHLEYGTQPFAAKTQTTTPTTDPKDIQYASGVHLAYVITSSAANNDMAKRGLEALSIALSERTSVEPRGVVGLNLEKDDLAFFPIIYWPITNATPPLSAAAKARVQDYINNQGLIVFDSRDDAAMKRVLDDLNLSPLREIGEDHSLTRSFYLISSLPGSTRSGQVLAEAPNAMRGDTSRVIIGQRNWAGAWSGTTLGPMSREREMALRSGINMVMYALTGSYKQDQIHMKSILEKLGKPAPK